MRTQRVEMDSVQVITGENLIFNVEFKLDLKETRHDNEKNTSGLREWSVTDSLH